MPKGLTSTSQNCLYCGKPLPIPRNIKRRYHVECKPKRYKDNKRMRRKKMTDEEKENRNKHQREVNAENRRLALEGYGNKCECCGETQYEFLCIDHINGDGSEHRKEIGGGSRIYWWLIKNNFPEGFRVLCYNCNMSYGFYNYCPHQKVIS